MTIGKTATQNINNQIRRQRFIPVLNKWGNLHVHFMDTRKSTSDVLGSILSGTPTPDDKQASFSLKKKDKEKVTFNLPVELVRQLEEVWIKMRKDSSKRKVSKTFIVETILKQAFYEMETQQENSTLYSNLVKEE